MVNHAARSSRRRRRRAAVAVFTVVVLVVLLGFTALTIDIGMMQVVRAELQRTADSATLAAVQDLRESDPDTMYDARATAREFVALNPVLNERAVRFDEYRDVVFGRARMSEGGAKVEFLTGVTPPNAVQVTVHYDLELIFAKIFGFNYRTISARAMSAVPPPRTVDVIPAALPTPGFGPVDPAVTEHNPGKISPSEPANEERFEAGEEVAVFFFGKGPRQAVHLVLDITEENGIAELNRMLATEEALGGARSPDPVSVGDEYLVWGEGLGNANFGEKLETRLTDYDPFTNDVVMPIVDALENSRDEDGRLVNEVRIVDFVAVHLTEIREEYLPDPLHEGSTMAIQVMYGNVIELFSGSGIAFDTTSGKYTLGSVRTSPQLLQ